jgi:cytochrome c peroxidase
MQKKWIGIAAGGLLVLGLAVPLSNLLDSGRRVAATPADPQVAAVSSILQAKCADCHASAVAKLPFYAAIPPAKGIVQNDQQTAERWWRFSAEKLSGAEPFTDSDLGHLEVVLAQSTMPPPEYVALHWRSLLSSADRQTLAGYIRQRRSSTPEAGKMAEKHRGEPVMVPARLDRAKVALGDRLYHEKRLSGDDTLSCASCHALNKGGTDQAAVSTGIGGQLGPINSPTTFNSSYNLLQFWDGRAKDLQDQAGGPVENPKEMGAKFPAVIAKLQQDESYVAEFTTVYPGKGISKATITDAIAEFERSLATPDAPFDKYLAGDDGAIGEPAKTGYALFKSIGCTACHDGPAVGGGSFQHLGIAADYFADRGNVGDADSGRFSVTGDERDRHSFKVPTLRNIVVTQPYFHDGSAKTLEVAVQQMAKYQRGRTLSETETTQLVAFLGSLTGNYGGKAVDRL